MAHARIHGARIVRTQRDVSSDDEPLMMRPSSGRFVVPRMGERDPEESRDNQVDVTFGQSSAIVVGPPQVLEPISPTNVIIEPAAPGEIREARRALLLDSAGPTLINHQV